MTGKRSCGRRRPAKRPLHSCAAAVAGLALALPAAHAGGSDPAAERSDVAWLQLVQDAARHLSYTGTIVYNHGDEVHTSTVIQSFDGTQTRERVHTLDGPPREFIRQGGEVQCLYPNLHRVVVEHGGPHAFPTFSDLVPAEVLTHYELRRDGQWRVAGRSCEVIELLPRDTMRYGYRLCVDPATGLRLKAQTIDDKSDVLEQMAFTEVRIGGVDPATLNPSWSTAGWAVVRQQSEATELQAHGWSVTPPGGFHRLAEMFRHLGHTGGAHAQSALQGVFSDGLATVSVFIEPDAPPAGDPEESQRHGSISAFSRRLGDARVTVVGEVPPSTAQSIAQSVARVPPHP